MTQQRSRVVFGPELPQFGSWNWLGRDLVSSLSDRFDTQAFRDEIGSVDVLVVLKFLPPLEVLRELQQRTRIVYCPVDLYGAASDIDADSARLQCCDRIVVHCERLVRYFRGYAPVFSLPHHVKYISDIPAQRPADGPLLWIGVRGNLPPVVEWVNQHGLPRELVVLTDVEPGLPMPTAAELGFQSGTVRVEPWTVENHLQWLPRCRAVGRPWMSKPTTFARGTSRPQKSWTIWPPESLWPCCRTPAPLKR